MDLGVAVRKRERVDAAGCLAVIIEAGYRIDLRLSRIRYERTRHRRVKRGGTAGVDLTSPRDARFFCLWRKSCTRLP